jgi:hypothetical protein
MEAHRSLGNWTGCLAWRTGFVLITMSFPILVTLVDQLA